MIFLLLLLMNRYQLILLNPTYIYITSFLIKKMNNFKYMANKAARNSLER